MKILDTTVAIDYLRGDRRAIDVVDRSSLEGWTGASEIVRYEILAGMRPDEQGSIERFFSALGWIPIDETVSRVAGSFARRFRRSHEGIDAADYFIAATAEVVEAQLLTTNVRHFPMLPGLEPAY